MKTSRKHEVSLAFDTDKGVRRPWQAWLSGSPTLLISILFHLLILLIATVYVVQRIQEKKKPMFREAPNVSIAPVQAQKKVQMVAQAQATTVPDFNQRITTTELSPVSLPEVDTPTDSTEPTAAKLAGAGISGQGTPNGTGQGMGGGIQVDMDVETIATSAFGTLNGGVGLTGRFYDLKQNKSQVSTNMTLEKYGQAVAEFMSKGWPDDYFKDYFVGPHPLYLSQVFIPMMDAANGPKAYKLEDLVKPRMWVAVYKGRIKAKATSVCRFVGWADDVLAVAINHKTVLDGCIWSSTSPRQYLMDNHGEKYVYKFPVDLPHPGPYATGAHPNFSCGSWFTIRDSEYTDIEIIIGEQPGGEFGSFLFVEQQNHTYSKTPNGAPILPLFKLSNVDMTGLTKNSPPYDHNADLGWSTEADDSDPTESPVN